MTNVSQFPRTPPTEFEPFSAKEWSGKEPPGYDWLVDGCFLRGTVAMLSGDGGLGKSLLMQQLCTAAAVGKDWLGLETKQCTTFALFCEDDKDELHRRQANINRHYRCDMDELDAVRFISRAGMENVLMEFDRRTDAPRRMPLFDQLRQYVIDIGAQIIVLDTVADVFAGNEIIRNQVRRFISALRKLAIESQGVVVLTAHPSNAGLSSGTGISGSTAWNNSVRSRIYLTRTKKPNDDGEEEDANSRFFKTMKNNQGPYGGKIRLHWEDGVFLRQEAAGSPASILDRIEIDNLVLDVLVKLVGEGTKVSADRFSPRAFAKVIRDDERCRRYSLKEIDGAKERLLGDRRIEVVKLGDRPSRSFSYVVPMGSTGGLA